jgi:hypothetical protein
MRWMAYMFLAMMLGGCSVTQPSGYVAASAWSANYTEDYIYDFSIQTASGKRTGVGGSQVSEFSRGGQGGIECCALVPGVGQTIKVAHRRTSRRRVPVEDLQPGRCGNGSSVKKSQASQLSDCEVLSSP